MEEVQSLTAWRKQKKQQQKKQRISLFELFYWSVVCILQLRPYSIFETPPQALIALVCTSETRNWGLGFLSYKYVTTPNWHEKFISTWQSLSLRPEDSDLCQLEEGRRLYYYRGCQSESLRKTLKDIVFRTRVILYECWTAGGESVAYLILGLSYGRLNKPKNSRFSILVSQLIAVILATNGACYEKSPYKAITRFSAFTATSFDMLVKGDTYLTELSVRYVDTTRRGCVCDGQQSLNFSHKLLGVFKLASAHAPWDPCPFPSISQVFLTEKIK